MSTFFTKICNPVRILKTISVSPNNSIAKCSSIVYLDITRCYHAKNAFSNYNFLSYQKVINGKINIQNQHARLMSSHTNLSIQDNISPLQIKKRPVRKKRILAEDDHKPPGLYDVVAFATSEEYKLEELIGGLKRQNLYDPKHVDNNLNVVHAIAKYQVGHEPRELFFFREGTVVMWNVTDLESSNVLGYLKQFENDSYSEKLLQNEAEFMNYKYLEQGCVRF